MQTQLRPPLTREAPPRRQLTLPRRIPAAAEFLLFYLAAALRFLYYGFTYYPQLDDYIQLGKYPVFAPLGEMIERLGLFASRPIAGVADLTFWAQFWRGGTMILAVLLLAALLTGSAVLFRHTFDRLFGCSSLFTVIYLLLPLNFEGTYWVSAATRVVCGLFFCALSLFCLGRLLEGKSRWYALGFGPAQLAAFGFYEQSLALAGGAAIGMSLLYLVRRRSRCRCLWGLLTAANLAIYFAFTAANATGSLADRMQLVWPWDPGYSDYFLPDLLAQLQSAFLGGGWYTLTRGFVRGFALIIDGGWWYLILFVLIALAVAAYALTPDGGNGRATRRIPAIGAGFAYAALLILAPLSLFFIIGNPWFSLRCTVHALPGIALLTDLALRTVFGRRARTAQITAAILAGLLTLVCGIASASELHDYRATYQNDRRVLEAIAAELDGADGRIGILGLEPSFLERQNCFYHEHIHGVTESHWALQGALWSMTDDQPDVYPLSMAAYPYYVAWNRDLKRISAFDALYRWDNAASTLIPLTATGSDESGWLLTDAVGTTIRVWEYMGAGYLEIE